MASLRHARARTLASSQVYSRGGCNDSRKPAHTTLSAIRCSLEFQPRDSHQFLGCLPQNCIRQLHYTASVFSVGQLPELGMPALEAALAINLPPA
jgi:hypothetical protein